MQRSQDDATVQNHTDLVKRAGTSEGQATVRISLSFVIFAVNLTLSILFSFMTLQRASVHVVGKARQTRKLWH